MALRAGHVLYVSLKPDFGEPDVASSVRSSRVSGRAGLVRENRIDEPLCLKVTFRLRRYLPQMKTPRSFERGVSNVRCLPAIVSESLVRLGHPVSVFLFLDRVAFALGRGNHFSSELLGHRLLSAAA